MTSISCALIVLSTLLLSCEVSAGKRRNGKKQGKGGVKAVKTQDPVVQQGTGSVKIQDSVVRLSNGQTISCDWGDFGQCSRKRKTNMKKCFRMSKICPTGPKSCRTICVQDPAESYSSCFKTRYCRDKWGLPRKTENLECNCLEAVSFRRAWLMRRRWRRH